MDLDVGVFSQESLNQLRLVAADLVADDMDLAAFGLAGQHVAQEAHELLAGVTWGGHAQHFAGGGVQRREQAERAVALVLNAVALGAAGGQGQHAVLAAERLD